LAESFTPVELTGSPVNNEEIDDEEQSEEVQRFQQQTKQPINEQPPDFFDDKGKPDQFFGGKPETIDFFGSKIKKSSAKKVRSGIPDVTNLFDEKIKVKRNKPIIGNLREGIGGFDSAFGNQNALKRGTGFDNFIGDININALSKGLPDSAVPKTGIFSKSGKKVRKPFRERLSPVLPIPEGFEKIEDSGVLPISRGFESIEQAGIVEPTDMFEVEKPKKRKAGRPFGSVGKKKRQARKIQKKKKKKELDKARVSLLKERSRLADGGVPRNKLQSEEASVVDNSFRGFFS